jgi:hypothetical protein
METRVDEITPVSKPKRRPEMPAESVRKRIMGEAEARVEDCDDTRDVSGCWLGF